MNDFIFKVLCARVLQKGNGIFMSFYFLQPNSGDFYKTAFSSVFLFNYNKFLGDVCNSCVDYIENKW